MNRCELLQKVERGWHEFRARVRHVGRDAMSRPTPVGWTYRDLVAHVAAWEELSVRRIRTYRETGEKPPFEGDVDAFNARAIAERRLVGPEAIVDELDTAHRLLVEELRRLTEEQAADDWVRFVVAVNTFEHYAEHAAELAALGEAGHAAQ